ncbi:MAG: GNAT family N-acetyltransferase [Bacteroidota bacterium]|nr:GNAT family N-acetyltransferase [Bacteroidota bacterium]MDP4230810.1 GNAT family N-acetyltransferase [Bacteroidota bacterium]MDP4235314.1 GNAT family N-acetyltransferase [Bacteroidota bacterium]
MKHLVTPRLLMRPFVESDLGEIYSIYSNANAMKYVPPFRPLSLEESTLAMKRSIEEFVNYGYGSFAVFERKEKRLIGRCGLSVGQNGGLPELECILLPDAWGKGYATEALIAILRSAFDEWSFDRIIARSCEENRASKRVMEKLGMSISAHTRFQEAEMATYLIDKPKPSFDSVFQTASRPRIPAYS